MLSGLRCLVLAVLLIGSGALAQPVPASSALDLPACEVAAPGSNAELSLGIVQPYASEALVKYAVAQAQAHPELNVCGASWREVLPRWAPWSPALERGMGLVVFVLAFVLAVTLLWFTTPRDWWRRTSLLGVLGVGGLTWALAVGTLAVLQALGAQRLLYDTAMSLRVPGEAGAAWINLKDARDLEALLTGRHLLAKAPPAKAAVTPAAATPVPVQPTAQVPSGEYRVAHRLNLRSGPSTQHEWLATLPRGEVVQYDGESQGDWWRLRRATGEVAWGSSLWLRRPQESLPPPAEGAASPRS